ncbi:MAG: hypothetical protein GF349_04550 [Candidatus Magasanikbacteria bacterium]|nr:hypothetical protein [Candidatus Magasanikbacteria bacterium]
MTKWKMLHLCHAMMGADIFPSKLEEELILKINYKNINSLKTSFRRFANMERFVEFVRIEGIEDHFRWSKNFLYQEAGFFPGMFTGELNESLEILHQLQKIRNGLIDLTKKNHFSFPFSSQNVRILKNPRFINPYGSLLRELELCIENNFSQAKLRIPNSSCFSRNEEYIDYDEGLFEEFIDFMIMAGVLEDVGKGSGMFGRVWQINVARHQKIRSLIFTPLELYLPK